MAVFRSSPILPGDSPQIHTHSTPLKALTATVQEAHGHSTFSTRTLLSQPGLPRSSSNLTSVHRLQFFPLPPPLALTGYLYEEKRAPGRASHPSEEVGSHYAAVGSSSTGERGGRGRSLVCQDSLGYLVRPCLKQKKQNKSLYERTSFCWGFPEAAVKLQAASIPVRGGGRDAFCFGQGPPYPEVSGCYHSESDFPLEDGCVVPPSAWPDVGVLLDLPKHYSL